MEKKRKRPRLTHVKASPTSYCDVLFGILTTNRCSRLGTALMVTCAIAITKCQQVAKL